MIDAIFLCVVSDVTALISSVGEVGSSSGCLALVGTKSKRLLVIQNKNDTVFKEGYDRDGYREPNRLFQIVEMIKYFIIIYSLIG